MKLKIAVCDDDLQWSERIRQSISEYMCHVNQQCDIQVFESGEELCGAFHGSHSFDIVFLDVDMDEMDGMETAGVAYTGMQHVGDVIMHMVLPVVCLTLLSVGSTTRYVRTSMLEVIRQDYVRTARAKGLPERVVIYKHALKNGMIPIVTFVGGALPSLFAGAMITETIFAWPGIGKVFLGSIGQRDYLFMMGFTMFLAVLVMVGNLLSDILYGVVDPRIRLK